MTEDEINQREWNDLNNWSSGIYRSRTDSRMFVPKRQGFGLTINFGKRNAVVLFVVLLAFPLVIFLVLFFCGVLPNRH